MMWISFGIFWENLLFHWCYERVLPFMLYNFLSSESHKIFQHKELICVYNCSLGFKVLMGSRDTELQTKEKTLAANIDIIKLNGFHWLSYLCELARNVHVDFHAEKFIKRFFIIIQASNSILQCLHIEWIFWTAKEQLRSIHSMF